MPAIITVVPLLAFDAFTRRLVRRFPVMCQFSSQGLSTTLNFTIAFSGCLNASFNSSAPICLALRLFTTIKLTWPVLSVKFTNF